MHMMNILSGYPLFAFNMRRKHASDFLALVVSALSLRVCREAAPSTTLGTGSNYRLNHFITNSTFSPFHQPEELQMWKVNIIKARLQIKVALLGVDGEIWGYKGVCVCFLGVL